LRKSAPPTELPDDWIINPEQIVFNEEVEKKLKAIIKEQSEQCQQFFRYLFFYSESWSMTDIARELGLSNADTAKASYYRCKKRLIKFIEERPGLGDWLKSFLG
jgi:DNA-directed RNA polymerase specialized sigma subunit